MNRPLALGALAVTAVVSFAGGFTIRTLTHDDRISDSARAATRALTDVDADTREHFRTVIGDYLAAQADRDINRILDLTAPGGPDHARWQNTTPENVDYTFSFNASHGGALEITAITSAHWQAPGLRAEVVAETDSEKQGSSATRWILRNTPTGWKVW
ncbi:hypothetical protein IU469_28810 [Nocardia puris]|uniref:hypothetical protein n=1 Tax=Nocardia puris TaxID=208602 RepID=UPI001893BA7F|nr:hypothetical protein [Nocardia puris]MBF6369689.1 hypothetical protein [Nocardia puris]